LESYGLVKRLILSLPFLIAAVVDQDRIAGCAFLFAAPWAWLIDVLWFYPPFHSKWINAAVAYVFILWVPATLYSVSLWLLFLAIAKLRTPRR